MSSCSNFDEVPARLVGVRIETPLAILRREAMIKHQTWLNDPNLANQLAYAQALKYWAKEANNKIALAHALELQRGIPQ